ncbi:hypothetical protein IT084_13715 [Desulfallas sp. Bu1-1]|uniref:hypothetical protein n=1 Tax=Desulfallas sp. Bu1-1 TaxID=2787620 RepID=UPI00189DDF81|nr:hypothetical protein [Desulfallas sp. Bu1-1]MBF7084025.1 hypothetical protein [Desulfallas sp. Bu1-1]
MPEILSFSRNRCTSIEQVDDRTLRSTCRTRDNLMDAGVEITVKLPDLELTRVKCTMTTPHQEENPIPRDDLQKLIGSRVGPGIKKIIWSAVERSPYAEQIAAMLDECCNGIILSFTRDVLIQAPKDQTGEKEFFAGMVRANPRLYNSCAALAPDSPLMEFLELDKSSFCGGKDA